MVKRSSFANKLLILPSCEDTFFLWLRPSEARPRWARGGFVVDMAWNNGQITSAVIHSKVGGPCKVRYKDKLMELDTKPGENYDVDMN